MKTPQEIKHGLECCTNGVKCIGLQCEYYGDFPVCIINLLRDAMEYINELEARAPRWISVNDIVPDKDSEVLVCDKNGAIDIGFYNGTWHSYNTPYRIIHWMPLPKAPEE